MAAEETAVRKMSEITCPKCDKQFELRWDPPPKVPETLLIIQQYDGVSRVDIECPHCNYRETIRQGWQP